MAKSPSPPPDSAPMFSAVAEAPAESGAPAAAAPAPAAKPEAPASKAAAAETKPEAPAKAAAAEAKPEAVKASAPESKPEAVKAPAPETKPEAKAPAAEKKAPAASAPPAAPAPAPKVATPKSADKAETAPSNKRSAPVAEEKSKIEPKLPPQFRELAEKNVERAKKAYEQYVSTTERMLNTIEDTTRYAWSGARDVNLRMLAFADANAKAGFDYAERFVKAKDLKEIAQLQQEYLQQSTERLAQQMREIQELAGQAAKDALKAANPKK